MIIALLTTLALSSLACAYPTADSLSVSSATGDPGEMYVPVLINITNVTDGPIQAILLDVIYDHNVIGLTRARLGSDLPKDAWGDPSWSILLGTNKKSIALYSSKKDALPDGTTGNILKLYFNVTGTARQTSPIGLSSIDLSSTDFVSGTIPAINGTFTVNSEDLAPSLVTYTISNTTISPNGDEVMDTTAIDLEFSEPVSAAILIENGTGVVKTLYSGSDVADPDPQVWNGTDDSGNTVAYGTYNVNVTMDDGVNPIVHDNTRSITVAKTSVAIISIGNASGTVTIPITIEDCVNVGACDITLTYDPSIVNVTNVTGGDLDATVANLEHTDEGWVRIGAFQTDNSRLSGTITFANVMLEAGSAGGTCFLNLSVTTFKDATAVGNPMPYVVKNGTYTAAMNGDVNGNGVVDMHDAMYLAKHVLNTPGFTEIVAEAADVNGDGGVTSHDVMYLAKYLIGIGGYDELR